MATFEGYERREAKILSVLKEYGINSIDECKTICEEKGIDPYTIVQETQPICFENAKWAYTVGCAIAIKIALNANKVRTKPLRVILNGLGKDAAFIISRINGFTYVETEFDPYT